MTQRRRVSIRLEQLVDLHSRPPDEFFTDWRCRLCHRRSGAVDRETALNDAATHLQTDHRAAGGVKRK
ncbi:MAG: hypothetical protein ACREN2_13465 [Candidatus Dormibacteria bacterium]